jgi:hypothetical protein
MAIGGLFIKGVGLAELWREALAFLGFGIVILSMSIILCLSTNENPKP